VGRFLVRSIDGFREHFSLARKIPSSPSAHLGASGFFGQLFLNELFTGLRVASDIRPNEWLRISPSVTYFDYGPGIDFSDLPRVALGLDLNLVSSSKGWSLSTGFQYPLSRYASTRFSDSYTADSHIIDMSLTFRQC